MKKPLLYLAILTAACTAHSATGTAWETASVESAKIAVPKEWRSFDGIERARPMYRQGDGIGVPATDETGAPLQIGLTLEKFPATEDSTETIAKKLAAASTKNPELEMVGKESIESITLSDQTAATLVTIEFIKRRNRRSFYMKVIGKDAKGQVWVATGYLVSGIISQWPKPKSVLVTWLRAHLVSLTLTGKDIDPQQIDAAYRAREGRKLEDFAPADLDPRSGVTGCWIGSWRDPQRNTAELFRMDLVQQGTNVTGAAIFMDADGTKADVTGQATGSQIRLLMVPNLASPHDALKTTWTGTITSNTISGAWQLQGKPHDGYASTGSWSATFSK